jgi:hypothetical protein
MNDSVASPTMNGRKKAVRKKTEPNRPARTSSAIAYPTTKIGPVTIAV